LWGVVGVDTVIIVGFVGAVGALLGVGATAWFTRQHERVKWRREQSVKFDADRVQAYVEFLAAMDKVLGHVDELAREPTREKRAQALVAVYAKARLDINQADMCFHKVSILGSRPVVAVTNELHKFVNMLFDSEGYSMAGYADTRTRFYDAVRAEVHKR
jgi:hypothetical protein